MQNLACQSHHNRRLLEFCLPLAFPDGEITLERLIDNNLISASQVAELAVCKTSGVEMCSIGYGRDLTDDSDVKTVTVYEKSDKRFKIRNKKQTEEYTTVVRHLARVKDIKNKIGKLRIICFNQYTDKYYFYVVPVDKHKGLKSLSLEYDKFTGEPKGFYTQFLVPTWEELCTS